MHAPSLPCPKPARGSVDGGAGWRTCTKTTTAAIARSPAATPASTGGSSRPSRPPASTAARPARRRPRSGRTSGSIRARPPRSPPASGPASDAGPRRRPARASGTCAAISLPARCGRSRPARSTARAQAATAGVPALARSLHVSERHLHRVLVAEVGAGPLALARTRRAQTARLLLDATDLPITTVAFTAGFSSLRQFNDTMREHFGMAPRDIRRRPSSQLASTGSLTLRLTTRAPYAVASMLGWLRPASRRRHRGARRHDLPPRAAVRLGHRDADRRRGGQPHHEHRRRTNAARHGRAMPADARCWMPTRSLSTPRSPRTRSSPAMVAARPGLRVPGAADGFELLVRTVLAQQVSVASAHTFARRLVDAYGKPLDSPTGALTARFPTADALAEATLRRDRADRRRGSRPSARSRPPTRPATCALDPSADRDETRARLLALPGIGPWTADYVAMRALGDPDAFPGDRPRSSTSKARRPDPRPMATVAVLRRDAPLDRPLDDNRSPVMTIDATTLTHPGRRALAARP